MALIPLFPCSTLQPINHLRASPHQRESGAAVYQPGDHLGVFPGNHEDLVNALIERLEDAPPVNQLVKVELLEERNTALGNYGWATPKGASLLQGVPKAVGIWGRGDLSSQSPFQVGEWVCVTPSLRD